MDLDRVINEVLGDCQMFLHDGTLLPGPQKLKTVEEPTRSSKRLKEVNKGSAKFQ